MNEQMSITPQKMAISTKKKKMNYAKWGYIFLIPFVVVFIIFQLIPLLQTFYYSFFTYYQDMLSIVGPKFCGFKNYASIFTPISQGKWWTAPMIKYGWNTLIIWILGVVPQMVVSLLLAVWFTDIRLRLKGTRFFKTVIYMPNLVMASAMGLLFITILGQNGPIAHMLKESNPNLIVFDIQSLWGGWGSRLVIAFMNFLMWFGNTTLLLMAGVMGIDSSVYEAATIDGAGAFKTFKDITMPLLMPIFVYVIITSLIGGVQLFDAAEIFTQHRGAVDMTSKTWMMYLYNLITGSKNYGEAGAVSVVLFLITAILSLIVFKLTVAKDSNATKAKMLKQQAKILKKEQMRLEKEAKAMNKEVA